MPPIPTHIDFYKAMGLSSKQLMSISPSGTNVNCWLFGTTNDLSWETLLSKIKIAIKSPLVLRELVYRDPDYVEEDRNLTTLNIYLFRVRLSCWDSAWLRQLTDVDRTDQIRNLQYAFLDNFQAISGWAVLACCWRSDGTLDELQILLLPYLVIADSIHVSSSLKPPTGRPAKQIGMAVCRLPVRAACMRFSPQASTILRLQEFSFDHTIDDAARNQAKVKWQAATERSRDPSYNSQKVTAWINQAVWPGQPARVIEPAMPMSLQAALFLDRTCNEQRIRLQGGDDNKSFLRRVREIRGTYGEMLLLDEVPPVNQFSAKLETLDLA